MTTTAANEQDPEPRVFVGIRLRRASIERVERIASQTKVSKSAVYRLAFVRGLDQAEKELRADYLRRNA
jgi:hypothetical protein